MKRFQECAAVIDNGHTIGHYMGDTGGKCKVGEAIPWKYISDSEFCDLVSKDEVQFFVKEDNAVVCKVDAEELKALKKSGVSDDVIKAMQENYWNVGVHFDYKDYLLYQENGTVLACVSDVADYFGAKMCTLHLIGDNDKLKEVIISACTAIVALRSTIKVAEGQGYVKIVLPLMLINEFLEAAEGVLYNTNVLQYCIDNDIKTVRRGIFRKEPNKEFIQWVIDKFNQASNNSRLMM